MSLKPYVGRFAPSPTGAVHFGTLLAAVGSYLQAKKNRGRWLVRIEDVDITRKVDNSDKKILNTLEAFGMQWDGEIIYQSQQTTHYQQALETLQQAKLLFPCLCSRKQLAEASASSDSLHDIYPGTCRQRKFPETTEHAIRILAKDREIRFNDLILGKQSQNLLTECGDFVIKRRDGLFAYQLAVVVDDAMQDITEIVRGADLLSSTARQIYLQQLLAYNSPTYCHLPLLTDPAGIKISKSSGAAKVDLNSLRQQLVMVLRYLGQQPPDDLAASSLDKIWHWAIDHWDITKVPGTTIPIGNS